MALRRCGRSAVWGEHLSALFLRAWAHGSLHRFLRLVFPQYVPAFLHLRPCLVRISPCIRKTTAAPLPELDAQLGACPLRRALQLLSAVLLRRSLRRSSAALGAFFVRTAADFRRSAATAARSMVLTVPLTAFLVFRSAIAPPYRIGSAGAGKSSPYFFSACRSRSASLTEWRESGVSRSEVSRSTSALSGQPYLKGCHTFVP